MPCGGLECFAALQWLVTCILTLTHLNDTSTVIKKAAVHRYLFAYINGGAEKLQMPIWLLLVLSVRLSLKFK